MKNYKYVNLTGQTVRISGKRGGRVSLRHGEWSTDPYYDRMSHDPGEKKYGVRMLTRLPIDTDAMTIESLSQGKDIPTITNQVDTRIVEESIHTDYESCTVSCEVACMAASESVDSVKDEITSLIVSEETKVEESLGSESDNKDPIDREELDLLRLCKLENCKILESHDTHLVVDQEGNKLYVSKLERGWTTTHAASLTRHLNSFKKGD